MEQAENIPKEVIPEFSNRSEGQASYRNKREFFIEEYRMLRVEIESYTRQKRQLELSVITGFLVIYGWLARILCLTLHQETVNNPRREAPASFDEGR